MVEYSIAVCNYNMADTLERSLRSILDQLDERFEVVVVDGGSDDGSLTVLSELSEEYDALRVVELDPDPDRHLGADRNWSFREADGDHVFESLDTDEVYYENVVVDFAEIYDQLRTQLDFEFYLAGEDINLAPATLLDRIPYRNLKGAEDRDLARRLFAEDAIIWLDHDPVSEEIGYHHDLRDKISRDVDVKVCDFQVGIDFWSCMRWALRHERYHVFEEQRSAPARLLKKGYDLVTFPLAYLLARSKEQYETPAGFRRKGTLGRTVHEERKTLSEIEAEYGVEVDRSRISDAGLERFDL